MATKLILIRHGQTDWNNKKRYCGFSDAGINYSGRKQMVRLKRKIVRIKIQRRYSSDLKRAVQSAEIIFKKNRVNKLAALREIRFGAFEGLSHRQLLRKYRVIYTKWLDSPYKTPIPNGENLKHFKNRVIRAISEIISKDKNKTIAIICHGGVISVFLNYILKSRGFWNWIPYSGSVTVIEFKNKIAVLKVFNDISHLEKKK